MRSVAEIQAEITQVQAELRQASLELEVFEKKASDVMKEQDTDPEWRMARRQYIDTGDMNGINSWYNRRDQRKRDAIEQKRLDDDRKKEQSKNEQVLANNVELAEAALRSAKVANKNLSIEQQKAYVNEAEVKLRQAKAAYLEGTGKKWPETVNADTKQATTSGANVPEINNDGSIAQTVRDTLARTPKSGSISDNDLAAYINELNVLKSSVLPGSTEYDKIVETLADLRKDRGFKTIEDVDAEQASADEKARKEKDDAEAREREKHNNEVYRQIAELKKQLEAAKTEMGTKPLFTAPDKEKKAYADAEKKVKELENKIATKRLELK